jgi:DNA-directed RNA polymerase specialized sigma24 family protein
MGRRASRERFGRAKCLGGMAATLERSGAFEDFYRSERESILRTVAFAVGNVDLAAESVDEALARAYERWQEVGAMANRAGWVYRVALNLARNRLRRLGLERRKPPPGGREAPDLVGVADPEIARALAQLPLDLRSVVVLRYHLDWTVDEIAAALDRPAGTIKSRLHRALRRLESMLEVSP